MPTESLFDIAMRQQFPRRSTWPFKVSTECRAKGNHLASANDEPEPGVQAPEVWPQPPVKSFRQIEDEANAEVGAVVRGTKL